MATICMAALALAESCTSTSTSTSTGDPSAAAERLCRSGASGGESVVAAHLTTVDQVRTHRGGPYPGYSPAEKPWAGLPADDPAAWCAFHAGARYTVAAVTAEHPRISFTVTDTMVDPGTDGPAIP